MVTTFCGESKVGRGRRPRSGSQLVRIFLNESDHSTNKQTNKQTNRIHCLAYSSMNPTIQQTNKQIEFIVWHIPQ